MVNFKRYSNGLKSTRWFQFKWLKSVKSSECHHRKRTTGELTEDGHGCFTRVPAGVVGHLAHILPRSFLVVGAQTLEDAGALRRGDVVLVRSEDLLAVFVPDHHDFRGSGVGALQR